jgi:hypothetical protein
MLEKIIIMMNFEKNIYGENGYCELFLTDILSEFLQLLMPRMTRL